jgi:hypothetical protein
VLERLADSGFLGVDATVVAPRAPARQPLPPGAVRRQPLQPWAVHQQTSGRPRTGQPSALALPWSRVSVLDRPYWASLSGMSAAGAVSLTAPRFAVPPEAGLDLGWWALDRNRIHREAHPQFFGGALIPPHSRTPVAGLFLRTTVLQHAFIGSCPGVRLSVEHLGMPADSPSRWD